MYCWPQAIQHAEFVNSEKMRRRYWIAFVAARAEQTWRLGLPTRGARPRLFARRKTSTGCIPADIRRLGLARAHRCGRVLILRPRDAEGGLAARAGIGEYKVGRLDPRDSSGRAKSGWRQRDCRIGRLCRAALPKVRPRDHQALCRLLWRLCAAFQRASRGRCGQRRGCSARRRLVASSLLRLSDRADGEPARHSDRHLEQWADKADDSMVFGGRRPTRARRCQGWRRSCQIRCRPGV